MSKSKLVQIVLMLTCQLAFVFSCFARVNPNLSQKRVLRDLHQQNRNTTIRKPYQPRIENPSHLFNSNIRSSNTPINQALATQPKSQLITKDFICQNRYSYGVKQKICKRIRF